jgi:pyruvate/2-oxoacid:ferredoxin oxidoreductase alpha subunit
MIVGRFRAYVGFLFILAAYIRKIRIEERSLEQRFGDEYRQYEEFVPPVLPIKGTDAVAATVKNKQEEKAKQAEEKKEANDQDRRKSA